MCYYIPPPPPENTPEIISLYYIYIDVIDALDALDVVDVEPWVGRTLFPGGGGGRYK